MNFGKILVSQLGMILLITMVTVTSSAAPSWNGSLGTEDGWPLVNNPMQSMEGDQTITAEEIWRLGDEDDEQETVFGLIGDGLVDDQGNTYLLDTDLSTIFKIGPDGTIMANLGHEGDGPGEFRNATRLVFLPGGDLGIQEMMPGGIATLGRDGKPAAGFDNGQGGGGMSHIMGLGADENGVTIGQTSTDFGNNQSITSVHSLARYDRDGTLIKTLFEEREEMAGGRITLGGDGHDFAQYWCLGTAGRIVVYQENQEYKLEVFSADGEPEMIIRREYKPVRRPDSDIARDKSQREELAKRFGDMGSHPVPEIARHISSAFVRPNGNLWVQNSQGDFDRPENSIGYFDVFNQQGQYLKRVLIEADYDPDRDNFRILDNNLLVFKEAQKAPDRTMSSGGGGMMMVMVSSGSGEEEDEDEEPRPYEVVFYRLP